MSGNKWWDAKPGSIVFINSEEEMYEWEIIKLEMEKENKTHMELQLEHEVKKVVCVLRLVRCGAHIWLVSRKDGVDTYLLKVTEEGIFRNQVSYMNCGFPLTEDHRIKLVGE